MDGPAIAWGDYDNDGDLDILLAGAGEFTSAITRVYRNDDAIANTRPPPRRTSR